MSKPLPIPNTFRVYVIYRKWENVPAGEIVREIASESHYGVVPGDIRAGETIQEFFVQYQTAEYVLDRLAYLCGYVWWVDPTNRLNFGPTE